MVAWADLEHSVSQTIALEPERAADLGPYSYCERFEKAEAADPPGNAVATRKEEGEPPLLRVIIHAVRSKTALRDFP